ncbi:hypothetical protein [Agromyces sp. LHK192]|uniref:hypothetical protein n=1 Tax=Agromyces sp. LHK192 TaxID=2498704 RepID=UPI00196A5F4E|nr:hypothetical protein [Agromyces sp. LHK192]
MADPGAERGSRSGFAAIARAAAGAALLVNAVPHGIAGVQGAPFPTPFADPPGVGESGPVANIAWSAINAAVGAVLLRRGLRGPGQRVAAAIGAVTMAAVLGYHFGSVRSGGNGLRGVHVSRAARPHRRGQHGHG